MPVNLAYFDIEHKATIELSPWLVEEPKADFVINRVITAPHFRGKGYARALMKQLLQDADMEEAVLLLEINPYGPMTYAQLRDWYERCGFQFAGDRIYIRHPRYDNEMGNH